MIASAYTTLTNVGGIRAYVSVSIAGPSAWPAGSSAALTYALHGFTYPVISGVRIGPIANSDGALVIVTVDTTNMVAASSPYTAVIGLTYYRDATGGVAVDSDVVNLTVDILQRRPIISLTGTLSFTTTVGATLPQTANMIVKNIGDALSTLTWAKAFSVTGPVGGDITSKFSLAPATGILAYGATDNTVVTLDPTGIVADSYSGVIQVDETIVGGVTPKTLPVSVLVSPKYTGSVKMVADNGIGNQTMSYNAGGGGPDYDKWSYVWAPASGKVFLYRYYDGHYTAFMSNSIGVNGPVVPVTATVDSGGYPSGGPVSVSQGGTTITFSFGPSVW